MLKQYVMWLLLEAHVKSVQWHGGMSSRSMWRHDQEAIKHILTKQCQLLCLPQLWIVCHINLSRSHLNALYIIIWWANNISQSWVGIHDLCVVCLGAEHAHKVSFRRAFYLAKRNLHGGAFRFPISTLKLPMSSALKYQTTVQYWGRMNRGMGRCLRRKRHSWAIFPLNLHHPWRPRPYPPGKITSALVGKPYTSAGQGGECLHTMSILQAYQAGLLKDLICLSVPLRTWSGL